MRLLFDTQLLEVHLMGDLQRRFAHGTGLVLVNKASLVRLEWCDEVNFGFTKFHHVPFLHERLQASVPDPSGGLKSIRESRSVLRIDSHLEK